MPETDHRPVFLLDLAVGFALLTRLPLPRLADAVFVRQARAVWTFALVGAVVGLLAGGAGWAAMWAGLPGMAAAGLVLMVQIVVTGAMHEDGLADTMDGLWGGWSRERRLEIMKDSAIGTYGVLALILSLGLRWGALSVLLAGGIAPVIAAGAVSRCLMPVVMATLPHARDDGLSRHVGRPGKGVAGVACLLGTALGLAVCGVWAAVPMALACVATAGIMWIARARIGGQTGDILGAVQQVTEIAMLLGFAATIAG